MKLLFVLQELPYPASNGVRQKVLMPLSYLARKHQCDILAIGSQSDVSECEEWAKKFPRLRILGVFLPDRVRFLRVRQVLALITATVVPASIRYRSQGLQSALERAVAQHDYDVVHVDLLSMAPLCTKLGERKRILSLNDATSLTMFGRVKNRYGPIMFRLFALVHGLLQLKIDRKLFRTADAVHFVSAFDADWCRDRFGVNNAVHIPLAVQPRYLAKTPRVGGGVRKGW